MTRTIDIISHICGVSSASINPESTFLNDLNLDRKDLIRIVTDLEDEYDIIIDYSLLESLFTVQDLHQVVQNIRTI